MALLILTRSAISCILAQALENVELAERRLHEIQKLVGDVDAVLV